MLGGEDTEGALRRTPRSLLSKGIPVKSRQAGAVQTTGRGQQGTGSRKLRVYGRVAALNLVRGASTAVGTTVVAGVVWWVRHR
jgi:hypothetical protein